MRHATILCLSLVSAIALLTSTCLPDDEPAPSGSAFVRVQGSALALTDIQRVEITVTGTGITVPIVQEIDGSAAAGWSGTIADIPTGLDRTFTGRAYDATTLLYEGAASPVAISGGDLALVTIFMQQVEAPTPFFNSAPRITGLTVSSYSVAPGGTVSLTVTAADPDVGDTLTYAWTAASGSYSNAGTPSTVWTAPGATGNVVLHIGVSDDSGATATLEIGISVEVGGGSAFVMVDINTAPEIISLVPSPTQIDIGDNTYLALTASDPDGDELNYLWDVDFPCDGSFANPTVEDATFYLSAVQTEWDDCVLTVRVGDGRGGFNTASVAVATGPDPCDGTICGPVGAPGELRWDASFGHSGLEAGGDVTYDPALDTVVTAGSIREVDEWRIVIDVFTPSGDTVDWLIIDDGMQEKAYAADTGDDGVGYVVGWAYDGVDELALVRQLTGGWLTPGWAYAITGPGVFDVEVGPSGDPYIVGLGGAAAPWDLWIARIDAAEGPTGGVFSELVALPSLYEGAGLDVTAAGHVVVCASFVGPASYDLWLGKYTLDLDELWTTTWASSTPADRDDWCEDLAVDGFGNIFVAGSVAAGDDADLWVAKFDSSGDFLTEVVLDDGGGEDVAHSLAIASNGTVYVVGEGDSGGAHPLLRAYRNTLLDLWTGLPLGDSATGVALHPSRDVLVTGTAPDVSRDIWVGRFAP